MKMQKKAERAIERKKERKKGRKLLLISDKYKKERKFLNK